MGQPGDGTPLITGARRGEGWVVLVHTAANPDWSNLPLSGLFVELLRKIAELARTTGNPVATQVLLPPRLSMATAGPECASGRHASDRR